jgi:Carboxypeptidase regulatory-like domain
VVAMRRVLAALLLFLPNGVFLGAQTFRGAINGIVTDPSGAVVPNAQVQTSEIATRINHNTITTGGGQFSLQDLPVGVYKISVTAPGVCHVQRR